MTPRKPMSPAHRKNDDVNRATVARRVSKATRDLVTTSLFFDLEEVCVDGRVEGRQSVYAAVDGRTR